MKTTAPNLIVYSGNDMAKVTAMGKKCLKHGAICLEPGAPTDAIHQEEFTTWVQLHPGEIFQRVIEIEFQ
jgi:galactose mutarotase-like enzyme